MHSLPRWLFTIPALLLAHCGGDDETSQASPPATDAGDAGSDAAVDAPSDTPVLLDGSMDADEDASTDAWGDGDSNPPIVESQQVQVSHGGVSARFKFEDAFDNVAGGDWYRDRDNETATLAWGESYVMMSLAAMFRATGSPVYLERLAWHVDGVLSNRDDHRSVADYRGVSAACWQNKTYQPADQPYCYVVHSGMIGYPIVEFARLVRMSGLEKEVGWDGATFGDKATAYVAAMKETVAAHDDQWNTAGYYIFRSDATFLNHAGKDLPLNQSNAMGRLLLALHDVTSESEYLDKATKLAQRFKAQISTGPNGEYRWNYWGGVYVSPGEDISHAAVNVDFAAMAAERGIVFDQADLEAFSRTFMGPVYRNDQTLSDYIGGGSTNGSSYRPQCGRWLRLTKKKTGIYTAVRDIYEADYPPSSVGSGSLLYGWAALAEQEPIHRDHFFYFVDWIDEGEWQRAEKFGANVLTTPPNLDEPSVMRLTVQVPRVTNVQQWDGNVYHSVVRWLPTGGVATRWVPYEPNWPFIYWSNGVLYQFDDAFETGQGIRVSKSPGYELPTITSAPPSGGIVGTPFEYVAEGEGNAPTWWALTEFPVGARIDPNTGAIQWTPPKTGTYGFKVRLQNDFGHEEQAFAVIVP